MDKVATMADAISTYVHDGSVVALEGFTHLIPYAAAHEIIRQGKRGLTLCRLTPDIVSDQLIAAGCVDRLVSSFFASGSAGSLYEIRRRVEASDPVRLEIEEYSHYGMVCRYQAGASGLPFALLRSYAGSDMLELNPAIRTVPNPYGEGSVCVVPALNPDVTIIHAQRAGRSGNTQLWGVLGVQQEAAYAAKETIVVVEELASDELIRSDPNRTLIPAHAVSAVVVAPRGAHPSYVQGSYDRDGAFYREWTSISRDPEALQAWIREWIIDVPDSDAYVQKLGDERWASLAVTPRLSEPVNYGSGR